MLRMVNYMRASLNACSMYLLYSFRWLPIKHSCVFITLQYNRNDGLTYVIVFFLFSNPVQQQQKLFPFIYDGLFSSVPFFFCHNIPLHCHFVNSSVYLCSWHYVFVHSLLFVGILFPLLFMLLFDFHSPSPILLTDDCATQYKQKAEKK